ncbi:hypothetical protein [Dehalococcoides mccartyi]|uniref:Uncharacterized protein n=1 Tax=Dehalococcoides mccartyi (strain ATCC BAA-2266 / KCTC 15142 / 195) TaxID=243164 RepID=Q3Z9R4_DEHM1|nr:hypothetical protein [Dehalococcoides mccartyi]AAW39870.1 hypothetical protein DET0897 [Dehalococcoides mccartyi 195]AAW40405.1 hypothetical protein DET0287 [Dehalococcoides mccartyi 195]AAW40444.1 hypothetical protein DET0264 [Dehalococcoides mccartyi 195]
MKNKNNNNLKPNTLVLDRENGFSLQHIENAAGRRWRFRGQTVFLYQSVNGVLSEYRVPAEMKEPPERTYRYLDWTYLVKELFSRTNPWPERIKIGLQVAIVLALLFFIYLIYSSFTGTGA